MSYKNKLFAGMKSHWSSAEYNDIQTICEEYIDKNLSNKDINKVYESLHHSFYKYNHDYSKFKMNLIKSISAWKHIYAESKKEMLNTVWEKNSFIKARNLLHHRIKEKIHDINDEQCNSMSFDIAWRISKYMADKDKIEGLIATYNDIKVLKDIRNDVLKAKALARKDFENKTEYVETGNEPIISSILLKINHGKFKRTSKVITSKNIINLFLNEYEDVFLRHFQDITDYDLKKKIQGLKTLKKHLLALIIWNIAQAMVDNGIITEISTIGNRYNLKDENGKPYEVSNKRAAEIFDVVSVLNFDMKMLDKALHKYRIPDTPKDKKEFIRTRLNQSSKVINLNYKELINDYGGLIY